MKNNEQIKDVRAALLETMVLIRRAEQRISDLYSEYEMRCPTHLCTGQEGISAGISLALHAKDMVFSGHRSHGHYIAKGGDLPSMFAELYGKQTGCAAGKGGSQHLIDTDCGFMGSAPILSSTISVGVGAAWSSKLDGLDQLAVVYFGDGATEEGVFHESVNFSAVHKLPVLFVCENNLYSVHSALDVRQPDRPISDFGDAHRIASVLVDGNDAVAVYNVAREAVSRARGGFGPTLIEATTYRYFEHCGPNEDIDLGYRSASELEAWRDLDPITRIKDQLPANIYSEIVSRSDMVIEKAVEFAKASPFPEPDQMSRHVLPEVE
ncbi:MAG: thiamine pyrophosphate-dependent dehydrogenase E1 component subunit alpha [Paracoccaceae bacterium]